MNTAAITRNAYLAAVTVFACTLALFTFGFVVLLPRNAGAYDFLDTLVSKRPLLAFVALPLSILFLVAPYYAAKWAYRGVMNACLPTKKKNTKENEN